MKKRYTEEQIIRTIKEHEAGAKVDDLCRQLGISSGTFYNWRSKFAGLEVNEAKRLRELEHENSELKKLLAEKLLEVEAMKDVLLVEGDGYHTWLYTTEKTDSERVRRKPQRQVPQGMLERELVQIAGRGASGNQSMARALQPCSPA